jgi:outer membrane protein insertion porin family
MPTPRLEPHLPRHHRLCHAVPTVVALVVGLGASVVNAEDQLGKDALKDTSKDANNESSSGTIIKPGTIREVKIVGPKVYHPDRIRFILTTRMGAVLDPLALADDVKAIEKMGPFINVRSDIQQHEDRSVTITFTVTEQPYVSEVEFADLGYFQRSPVEKFVETKAGSWLNPLILENDRRAIEAHFQDKGYRYAHVTVQQEDTNGNIRVIFYTNLGPEIKVAGITYLGLPAKVFPKQVNLGLLNSPGNPYHAEMMPFDQGAVVRTIQELGWLDARLNGTRAEITDFIRPLEERRHNGPAFAPDGELNDSVMLVYDLAAGERYYLGSVSFVGNTVASGAALREAFGMAEGAPFKRADIQKAIERSRRIISNQGYARCSFLEDRGLDLENHRVNLVIHVEEGRKYHIGRVDIYGNYVTKDAVVRRAIDLMPGDLWNDDDIDESKRQIQRTGLFKNDPMRPIRLSPRFPADRPDEADLRVELEEDSTGTLNFQVGFSSSDGVFVQAGFGERNFNAQGFFAGLLTGDVTRDWRGAGQSLNLGVQWSKDTTSADLNWTNPHLMDGPYALSLGYSYINSRRRAWEERRSIPTVSLGRYFLNNDLRLNLSYSYTGLDISNPQSDAPNDAVFGAGKYYHNALTLGQSYDRLDNPRAPTRGYQANASETYSGDPLSGSSEWWSYTVKGDHFLPLVEGEQGGVTYFHLNARWTQIRTLGDSDAVPFYQRYYGGGPSPRHRGFESDRLSPTEINVFGNRAYSGGTTDALVSAEISVPVQDTNEGIRLALFTDWGNVWGAGENMSVNDMRTAVGFGIRFPIMIPVALDFAWLLDARDGESHSQIQFTLGQFHY